MHILKDKIGDFKKESVVISPMAFKIWFDLQTTFQDILCVGQWSASNSILWLIESYTWYFFSLILLSSFMTLTAKNK